MFPAAASTAAAASATATAATSAASFFLFVEQLHGRCTPDNDTATTSSVNERQRNDRRYRSIGSHHRKRRDFSDSRYVSERTSGCTSEPLHVASNDATTNSRSSTGPDPLVDTHRQRYLGPLWPMVRADLQGCVGYDGGILRGDLVARGKE